MNLTRTTYRSLGAQTLYGLQNAQTKVTQYQNQLASGKRISAASDDPAAADDSMKLRQEKNADDQFLRNADSATTRLDSTDNALQQLSNRFQRVRELLVNSTNGALGDDSQSALATEVKSIKDDVTSLYNTQVLGRPIFGGTVSGTQAVNSAGTYVGDDQPIVARVSRNTTVRIDTKGSDVGADTVPALLDRISTDIAANQVSTSTDIADLDAVMKKVTNALSDVGARTELISNTKATLQSTQVDLTSRISTNEDADIPETIMNLQSQQVAYQAALGAASKVLTTSLVDYLK